MAGIACREDVEKEMRKNCISPQAQTQLTSTHPLSTGTVVKPSLKGPLRPQNTFNYAFLAQTVLGENKFTANPLKASPAGLWVTACKHHPRENSPSLGKAAGKTQGQGLRVVPDPRGPGGTCGTDLPDSSRARSRLSRRGNH